MKGRISKALADVLQDDKARSTVRNALLQGKAREQVNLRGKHVILRTDVRRGPKRTLRDLGDQSAA